MSRPPLARIAPLWVGEDRRWLEPPSISIRQWRKHGLSGGGPQPTWIQYALDKVYKLDQALIWNSNQALESLLGFGAKGITVEYSTDGTTWNTLGEWLAQAGRPHLGPAAVAREWAVAKCVC
jgi:hypothetical protein